MSFWDDLAVKLSMFCDDIRDTKIGSKILDDIADSVERAEKNIDRLEITLMDDVVTEGKKRGYCRAANEYGKVFRSIETEYKQAKELIEAHKNMYDAQSDALIEKLESLESQKRRLENQVKQKCIALSEKYDIPVSQVQRGLATGTLIMGPATVDILGMIYRYKEKKLREAEQDGYLEARELYESKIAKLKKELAELRSKGSADIKKMVSMIDEILDAIAEEQMKIAELKILL